MVIAVPYENGMISDHFGRTECFKIYTANDGEISSVEDVKTQGRGHFYMVQLLVGYHVDTVLSKGMGEPSRKALEIAGIKAAVTEENRADEAVKQFIAGCTA